MRGSRHIGLSLAAGGAPATGSARSGWTGMCWLSGSFFQTTTSMIMAMTEKATIGPARPKKGRMNSGARNGPMTVPRPKAPARLDMALVRSSGGVCSAT